MLKGAARWARSAKAAATPALLVFFAALALYSAMYVARGVRDPGSADGFYAYLYARSLAFDGDVDFRNDYAVCGDPYAQGIDRGTGRVDNPAYAGPALFWTPLVVVARLAIRLPANAPPDVRAGCRGPIAHAALVSAMPLGALAIALSFVCACRFARTGVAATAALLFAAASSLPQYASIFVSSSHVFQCVAAALVVWLSFRARDAEAGSGAARWRWGLVGLALGLCVMQRLSDLCVLAIPLALLADEPCRRRDKILPAAFLVVGSGLGLALTLCLYTHLYGSPFVLPQGRHYVHFGHAHPWLLLFAPHGGLFFTTPVAVLGFAGLVVAARKPERRRLAAAAAFVVLASVFVASAPLDWHGKATFGARRLVVLTPLFVIFASIALEAAAPLVPRRVAPLLAAVALVLFGVPVVRGVLGTTTGATPLEGGIESGLGQIAILPAKAFYAARFSLPMSSFRAATTDRFYRRSYRDLSWEPNVLDFRSAILREASSGFVPDARGLRMDGDEAKVVFTAGWPFADTARLEVHADAAVTVGVGLGTTFNRCDLGQRDFAAGESVVDLAIPAGCFDSGLVELRFRGAPGLSVTKLVLDDSRALLPPF